MGRLHRLAERRQAILHALEEQGQLSVSDLRARFGVSEVTIRGDLRALSQQGLLQRTRGGTMAINALPEFSFGVRQQQRAEVKAAIGCAAARRVAAGDTIALDASTTALAMLPWLRRLPELTVVTNSLKVAMGLLNSTQIHVLMPGGALRRESIALTGQGQEAILDQVHVNTYFVGARGLTLDAGLTDVSLDEVRTKKAFIARSQHVVALLDARKWGQVATATFAALHEVRAVISDPGAPGDLVDAVCAAGVEVELAVEDDADCAE